MNDQLDISKHPYGLGGGMLLSGSVTKLVEGYVYYPLAEVSASLFTTNITSGSRITGTFAAGLPVYANIQSVTQSSGLSIVYYGAPDLPRY